MKRLVRLDTLTPRETETLTLLADGLPIAEIAARMSLSKTTVRTYVRRITAVLHARSAREAACVYLWHKIRELEVDRSGEDERVRYLADELHRLVGS